MGYKFPRLLLRSYRRGVGHAIRRFIPSSKDGSSLPQICLALAKSGCEVTSLRLTGLEIQKSRLTSTVWSCELGLVSLRLKMAITTYVTCNTYAVLRMLQRCSGGMRLARLYLSNELTTAVPSKGRDLLRLKVSEPPCVSRKSHI